MKIENYADAKHNFQYLSETFIAFHFNYHFQLSTFIFLVEALAYAEVELTTAGGTIESVAPVNTDESQHGQIETDAEACGVVQLEGLELGEVGPTVTTLEEAQHPNNGTGTLDDGLTQFKREAIEDRATIEGIQRVVLIASQGDHLTTIKDPGGETVTAEEIASKGGQSDVIVVVSHPTKAETGT